MTRETPLRADGPPETQLVTKAMMLPMPRVRKLEPIKLGDQREGPNSDRAAWHQRQPGRQTSRALFFFSIQRLVCLFPSFHPSSWTCATISSKSCSRLLPFHTTALYHFPNTRRLSYSISFPIPTKQCIPQVLSTIPPPLAACVPVLAPTSSFATSSCSSWTLRSCLTLRFIMALVCVHRFFPLRPFLQPRQRLPFLFWTVPYNF